MKLASIEKITDVFPHPEADSLEFCRVLNFTCIVRKGFWSVGDLCVFIQPDTCLPNAEWALPYIKDGNRVRARKFRNRWSFGIVESVGILLTTNVAIEAIAEGTEVSKELGIIKYESPEPEEPGAESGFPYWMRKTGEDMWQTITIEEYYGQLVDATLKMDGKSMSVFSRRTGNDEQCRRTAGRRLIYLPEADNEYNRAAEKQNLFSKLESLQRFAGTDLVLRGELVQGEFNLYGVYDPETRVNYGPSDTMYFERVAKLWDIKCVPILEERVPLTRELIEGYQNAKDLNGKAFEGVVIVGDGFSFKVINLNYDSRK